MEKYIRERQEIYSDLLDAKALAEQELSEADWSQIYCYSLINDSI